jgi:hypothetical protein
VRKALVISYYWPPARSAGAQRISLFCKYLPEFGYETLVLTAGTGRSPSEAVDSSFEGVRLRPVSYWFNPADRMQSGDPARGRGAGAASALWRGVKQFVWLNLFIPDSRIGWYRPSRKAIDELVAKETFDVVVSTAPPYTAHLLGKYVKERHSLPWVVDMRDPWLESHVYNSGPRLWSARYLNALLERRVLEGADRVVCAMESQRELLSAKVSAEERSKFFVITNGYDSAKVVGSLRDNGRFTISYFGTSYEKGFPLRFIDQVAGLIRRDENLSRDCLVRVVGETPGSIRSYLQEALPEKNLEIRPHMPHEQFNLLLYEKQVLLLVVNEDPLHRYSLPSKLFEYLPTGNHILGIGPRDHEAANITRETGTGEMFSSHDEEGVRSFIRSRYEEWREGGDQREVRRFPLYERRYQAERLAGILDSVLGA